jgi:hypothetical protein
VSVEPLHERVVEGRDYLLRFRRERRMAAFRFRFRVSLGFS